MLKEKTNLVNSLPNNVLQSAHLLSTSSTYEELVQRLPRAKILYSEDH